MINYDSLHNFHGLDTEIDHTQQQIKEIARPAPP